MNDSSEKSPQMPADRVIRFMLLIESAFATFALRVHSPMGRRKIGKVRGKWKVID